MNGTAVKDLPIEYNFQETFINFYWNHILTPLNGCIFTNRTIRIGCFFIGTNRTIGTNGPLELPCTQPGHMGK